MKEVIFLVTWTLYTIIPFIPKATYDEYGRGGSFSGTALAIYQFSVDSTEHSKEFTNEAEADSFIARMPLSNNYNVMMGSQWCGNPKKTKKEVRKDTLIYAPKYKWGDETIAYSIHPPDTVAVDMIVASGVGYSEFPAKVLILVEGYSVNNYWTGETTEYLDSNKQPFKQKVYISIQKEK